MPPGAGKFPAAIGPAGHPPLPLDKPDRRCQGRLDDALGHVRQLCHHRLEPLAAHDVAIGDPEELPPTKPPQRCQHAVGVVAATDLSRQGRRQRRLLFRAAAADPHRLPGLGVGDHDLRQVGTGREDLEQHRQALRVALEERRGGERAADRRHEPLEGDEHAIWIAHRGQQFRKPPADDVDQVEGEPPVGEPDDRPPADRRIAEAGRVAAGLQDGRVVEQRATDQGQGGRIGLGEGR